MTKSSRSKWKKLHRRQRAQAEAKNTIKRVSKLHKKLELTAKGGISLVPPQDAETRFHFTNPEKNLRVPDPRREYNNDYRENRVVLDFSKALKLPPPRTNFYGKSDENAAHPMTVNYEVIDADAPIAGHAMTKADLERAIRKSQEAAASQNESGPLTASNKEESEEEEEGSRPVEYVFGMDDAAPRRVQKKHKLSSKKSATLSSPKSSVSKIHLVEEEEGGNPEENRDAGLSGKSRKKISSMAEAQKVNNVIVSTGGTSKIKKLDGNSGSRIRSTGTKSAKAKKKK